MSKVPQGVREQVAKNVYQQLDALRWETIGNARKSKYYSDWVNDPSVGGALSVYMKRDRVRVWLKDGPVKEYSRAINGQGRYAKYTRRRVSSPRGIVSAVLGDGWLPQPDSVQDKPLRCIAAPADTRQSRLLIWGAEEHLRDLVWAALLAKTEPGGPKPIIAVTRLPGQPLTTTTRGRVAGICAAAAVDVQFVVLPAAAEGQDAARQ